MKHINRFNHRHRGAALCVVMLSVAFFATSCDKSELCREDGPEALTLSSVISPATKGINNGTTFPAGNSMVVSADLGAGTGNAGANYFSGVNFTFSTDHWQPASGSYYWPLAGSLEILAYSSGSASVTPTWTNATNIRLVSSDFTADDVMVGGLTGATSASRTIAFKHALAKVMFTAQASVASTIKIKTITVNAYKGATINGAKSSGSSAVSFTTSSLTNQADISIYNSSYTCTASAASIGSAIVIPAQTPASVTITYTIANNGVDSPVMSVTKSLSTAMSAGSAYTLALNLTLTGLTVTASLSDWSSGGTSSVSI